MIIVNFLKVIINKDVFFKLLHLTIVKKIKNGNNRFVTGIATSNKSMIPIGFNVQNQVVSLSRSNQERRNLVIS